MRSLVLVILITKVLLLSSNKDYVKLEITLIAEMNGKSRRISFGLLDNNNIVTLKRKSTFGVKLAYQLTSVVQQTIKAVIKYRKTMKNKQNEGGETNNSSKSDVKGDNDVKETYDKKGSKTNNDRYKSFNLHPEEDDGKSKDMTKKVTCMVTDCDKEAVGPKGNPMFCEDHKKLYV